MPKQSVQPSNKEANNENKELRQEKNTRKKVWTRLKTGPYGWRNGPNKSDIELKNRLKNFDSNLGESKPKISFKWVPTEKF